MAYPHGFIRKFIPPNPGAEDMWNWAQQRQYQILPEKDLVDMIIWYTATVEALIGELELRWEEQDGDE